MCLDPVLGSRAYQARRQELLRLVSTDAVLGDRDMIHRNHTERYAKALEKSQAYVTLLERHEIVDPDEQTFVYQVIGEPLPIDVHRAMFNPMLKTQMDDDQRAICFPRPRRMKSGAYEQIELVYERNRWNNIRFSG
ncbi:hypothetical protein B5M09_010893 [Aphanomyces astaci]|uniref:Acyl-coenzyme A oxidase N-terminal domain-containing protein n=1 Tax=Aphanomyces astaci TaxID=112090 RepID=A0A3R8D2D1_APHAT|nr:hypothetical protein B5M09_010893 [Aphanomyces astaci]